MKSINEPEEPGKVRFPPGAVPYSRRVFYNIGKKALEREWYESAIKIFNLAEEECRISSEKIPICVSKSEAHRALAEMDDSRFEALKAVAYNREGLTLPFLNLANLLYHENEFEDSSIKFVKGIRSKDPQFTRGLNMVMGSLYVCVGKGAGEMFDHEVTGASVVRMKQELMGLAPQPKKLKRDQLASRQLKLQVRKKYLAGRYLGKIGEDKRFIKNILDTLYKMKKSPVKIDAALEEVVENTVDKLELKEMALWHRKPLYSFYSRVRSFQTSDRAQEFEAHKRLIDKDALTIEVLEQIALIGNLKDKDNYFECYSRMLRLKDKLRPLSSSQLPIKIESLHNMSEIMGEMYLSTKKILPQLTPELNDLRIKYYLGVNKMSWPVKLEEVNHVYVRNPKELINLFLLDLEDAQIEMEKTFLNFEIASLIGLEEESGKLTRKYCFDSLMSAKRARSLPWMINAVFIIAKSALTSGKLEEGTITLTAARELCTRYSRHEQAEFADRALLLLQHIKPTDFLKKKKSALAEEKRLLDIMPTTELKNGANVVLISFNEVPPWRRTSLPGAGTVKEREAELKELYAPPPEKMLEEQLYYDSSNWVGGLDDTEPYTVKDFRSVEELRHILRQVYTEPKYSQLLTLEGTSKDYSYIEISM